MTAWRGFFLPADEGLCAEPSEPQRNCRSGPLSEVWQGVSGGWSIVLVQAVDFSVQASNAGDDLDFTSAAGDGSVSRRPRVYRASVSNVLSHGGDSSIIPALDLLCCCLERFSDLCLLQVG